MEDIITVDNLIFEYTDEDTGEKNRVLDNVSLNVKEGEFLAVLGHNGSGKSTLAKHFNAILLPTDGKVFVDGIDTSDESRLFDIRRRVGMVFQNPDNQMVATIVEEDVAFAPENLGVPREEIRERVDNALETVGMTAFKRHAPHMLSGGQKQRVAIARALASDPKILLCDEATSALDPQTTSSILELLKKINRQFGITIVIITHQMSVVREICTHVAIMYEGEVVEKGLVADIFANPQSEVAKELIRKDTGSDIDADSRLDAGREKGQAEIKSGEKIRIVFSENSAFEPVIANLILTFGEPVNILKADTKNVGGVAKGEMILEFMEGSTRTEMMKQYLKEKGLAIGEVTEYVGS
mgnify:CR=1 FL=1